MKWSLFCVCTWQGLIDQLQRNKLLLIETQDAAETTLALANYQKVTHYMACVLRELWAEIKVSEVREGGVLFSSFLHSVISAAACSQQSLYRGTTCLENLEMARNLTAVRDFTENQGIVRENILSGKSCLKLFIVNCIFVSYC